MFERKCASAENCSVIATLCLVTSCDTVARLATGAAKESMLTVAARTRDRDDPVNPPGETAGRPSWEFRPLPITLLPNVSRDVSALERCGSH